MIEAESNVVIRTSREAIWRHLTRLSDWYRWYPGLHGVDTSQSISREGQTWTATGQMGRMLYRGQYVVQSCQLLERIEIGGRRKPWISSITTRITLEPEGPNCRLTVQIEAIPGFSLPGRLLLSWTLRNRLQREADEVAQRLQDYVEHTMPYH